ncbi:MAG TPA: hypothetical protein DCF68_02340 [Cyanothece sp. UBA12306]|nr:hypothetical protein [Cyanothece sp. UBA12306]
MILLPSITLAQVPPPTPQEIVQPNTIRPLPGKLDSVPVFNSNSPELVLNEGILLSTFPPQGKTHSNAHLNYPFSSRFDVFAHHVAKAPNPDDLRTLYLGILLHNPRQTPITVKILQGATYLSQPDAPFIELPPQVEDAQGNVYAGPGSRVMGAILRRYRQDIFPPSLVIPGGESRMLINLPIPVKDLDPPLNGRSAYVRLQTNGNVYAASLAKFAPLDENGEERQPTLEEWETLLKQGELVTPRDRPPTPPETTSIIYGRVAGVSQGSRWEARLTNRGNWLTIPPQGEAVSYPLSSLTAGTLGTNQVQSAPMLVRYDDTAYEAHGNYGVQYSLTLPLYNPTLEAKTVTIALETPIKQDKLVDGLRFLVPHSPSVFFRGVVRVRYLNDNYSWQTRYFHLVQHRGQLGETLVKQTIFPQRWQLVKLDVIYPPDATPPQVLTIRSEATEN